MPTTLPTILITSRNGGEIGYQYSIICRLKKTIFEHDSPSLSDLLRRSFTGLCAVVLVAVAGVVFMPSRVRNGCNMFHAWKGHDHESESVVYDRHPFSSRALILHRYRLHTKSTLQKMSWSVRMYLIYSIKLENVPWTPRNRNTEPFRIQFSIWEITCVLK